MRFTLGSVLCDKTAIKHGTFVRSLVAETSEYNSCSGVVGGGGVGGTLTVRGKRTCASKRQ